VLPLPKHIAAVVTKEEASVKRLIKANKEHLGSFQSHPHAAFIHMYLYSTNTSAKIQINLILNQPAIIKEGNTRFRSWGLRARLIQYQHTGKPKLCKQLQCKSIMNRSALIGRVDSFVTGPKRGVISFLMRQSHTQSLIRCNHTCASMITCEPVLKREQGPGHGG
jgi:hypothetical protein